MGLFDALGGIISGGATGGPFGAILGGVLGGIGGVAKEKQSKEAIKTQLDLMLRNSKEEALQQRQFALEDRAYRQGGIAKFQPYFNANYTSLSSGHAPIPAPQMSTPGAGVAPALPSAPSAAGGTASGSVPPLGNGPGGLGKFASASNNPLLSSNENDKGRSGYLTYQR